HSVHSYEPLDDVEKLARVWLADRALLLVDEAGSLPSAPERWQGHWDPVHVPWSRDPILQDLLRVTADDERDYDACRFSLTRYVPHDGRESSLPPQKAPELSSFPDLPERMVKRMVDAVIYHLGFEQDPSLDLTRLQRWRKDVLSVLETAVYEEVP